MVRVVRRWHSLQIVGAFELGVLGWGGRPVRQTRVPVVLVHHVLVLAHDLVVLVVVAEGLLLAGRGGVVVVLDLDVLKSVSHCDLRRLLVTMVSLLFELSRKMLLVQVAALLHDRVRSLRAGSLPLPLHQAWHRGEQLLRAGAPPHVKVVLGVVQSHARNVHRRGLTRGLLGCLVDLALDLRCVHLQQRRLLVFLVAEVSGGAPFDFRGAGRFVLEGRARHWRFKFLEFIIQIAAIGVSSRERSRLLEGRLLRGRRALFRVECDGERGLESGGVGTLTRRRFAVVVFCHMLSVSFVF